MNTPGKRALHDNLDKDEALALAVDAAVRTSRQDDWRSNPFKVKRVRNAIRAALDVAAAQVGGAREAVRPPVVRDAPDVYAATPSESVEERVERILALVKNQDEY
jgi:hypothetical protein